MTTSTANATNASPVRPSLIAPSTRFLLKEQVGFGLLVWLGYFTVVVVITLAIAIWGDLTSSAWQPASSAVQWFTFAIGYHVGNSVIALHITHGQTRREFGVQAMIFFAGFALAAALMVAAGFVIESGLYRIGGWPHVLDDTALYTSPAQLHLVLIQSFGAVSLWTAGGAYIGASFYRGKVEGGTSIVISLLLVSILGFTGLAVSTDIVPSIIFRLLENIGLGDGLPGYVAIAAHLLCTVAILMLFWHTIKDIPINNKAA